MKKIFVVIFLLLISCSKSEFDNKTKDRYSDFTLFEGVSTNFLEHSGLNREYLLYIPPNIDNRENLPVIFNFHGYQGQAEQFFNQTDLVEIANNHSVDVVATLCDPYEVGGANDKKELHELERAWQKKLAEDLLKSGVTIADTSRIDIRGDIKIGQNSFVDVNNVFEGNNVLGKNVHIGPNCNISNLFGNKTG